MDIFEITVPGTWLDYQDRDWAHGIDGQLSGLKLQFFEANAALNLFTQAMSQRPDFSWETREKELERRSEIRAEVEQELSLDRFSREASDTIYFETDMRYKRELWAQGRVPTEHSHIRPFIYARAFLYALDTFERSLDVLAKEPGVSPELATLHAEVAKAFPQLRGVRNTAHHMEDRSRGLGGGKPPKPMKIKGGALILNFLNNSRYGSTMADGNYGEIDVSPESMEHLQRILNGVLLLFSWTGPVRHLPSA